MYHLDYAERISQSLVRKPGFNLHLDLSLLLLPTLRLGLNLDHFHQPTIFPSCPVHEQHGGVSRESELEERAVEFEVGSVGRIDVCGHRLGGRPT